jgi:hypothetical protein
LRGFSRQTRVIQASSTPALQQGSTLQIVDRSRAIEQLQLARSNTFTFSDFGKADPQIFAFCCFSIDWSIGRLGFPGWRWFSCWLAVRHPRRSLF